MGNEEKKATEEEISSEFENAFKEEVAEDGKETETTVKTATETDKALEPILEEEKAKEKETITEVPEKEPAGDKEPTKEPAGLEDADEDPAKLTQQYKSLQGMFKHEITERKKLAEELTRLRTPEPAKPDIQKPEEKKIEELPPIEKNEKITSFEAEFPDVSDGVKELLKYQEQKFTQVFANFALMLKPFVQSQVASTQEAHLGEIRKAHSDFEQLRDDGTLKNWIEQQPGYKKEAYMKAYLDGSSGDVIDLISDFKKTLPDNGGNKDPEPLPEDPNKTKKLKDGEIVTSRKSPIAPRGIAGKEDYEGAWKEAPD